MLATLDGETQQEWELITASHADTPTTTELVTFLESRHRALRVTSDHPVTDNSYCSLMIFTIIKQGQ